MTTPTPAPATQEPELATGARFAEIARMKARTARRAAASRPAADPDHGDGRPVARFHGNPGGYRHVIIHHGAVRISYGTGTTRDAALADAAQRVPVDYLPAIEALAAETAAAAIRAARRAAALGLAS